MTTDYASYVQQDFLLRDNIANIALKNKVTGAVVNPVPAVQRDLNWRETQLGGSLGLEPSDQAFDIGCLALGDSKPNRGDQITASDGSTWTVISAIAHSVAGTNVFWTAIAREEL